MANENEASVNVIDTVNSAVATDNNGAGSSDSVAAENKTDNSLTDMFQLTKGQTNVLAQGIAGLSAGGLVGSFISKDDTGLMKLYKIAMSSLGTAVLFHKLGPVIQNNLPEWKEDWKEAGEYAAEKGGNTFEQIKNRLTRTIENFKIDGQVKSESVSKSTSAEAEMET